MQNPPPGQQYQGYGSPYGTPPNAPMTPTPGGGGPKGKSAIGLDANIAAALGYPIGVLAIINAAMEKENRFVRFHSFQAITLFVTGMALGIVFFILFFILTFVGALLATSLGSIAGTLFGLLGMLLWLIFMLIMFGGVIMGAVKAYQGEMYKLPVLGNIAERFVK